MIELGLLGDMFQDDATTLVNTVNEVGVSGRGIAAAFKRAFPQNFEAYRERCARGALRAGGLFVFQTGGLVGPKYIINLATKKHWQDPSRIEWIEAGLWALRGEIIRMNIDSLAMPLPGCGNGGLSPESVAPRVREILSNLDGVFVRVYGQQVSGESCPDSPDRDVKVA